MASSSTQKKESSSKKPANAESIDSIIRIDKLLKPGDVLGDQIIEASESIIENSGKVEIWKKAISINDLMMEIIISTFEEKSKTLKKLLNYVNGSTGTEDLKKISRTFETSVSWVKDMNLSIDNIKKTRRDVIEDKDNKYLGPIGFVLPIHKKELIALDEKEKKEKEKIQKYRTEIESTLATWAEKRAAKKEKHGKESSHKGAKRG